MKADLISCSRHLQSSFQARSAMRKRTSGEGSERPHVAVIGAGLSGLRCAEVLAEGGVEVTVIEARDRIGGRIYQSNLDGHILDMGPNWVHGTDDNPIMRLAKETNTKLCQVDESVSVFDPAGAPMATEDVVSGFEIMWSLLEEAFRYSNESCLDIAPDLSLKDFFHEKLAKLPLMDEDKENVLLLAEIWGGFIGDNWNRQSLRWFWLEQCLDGENLFVADTHGPIIKRIADKALPNAKLHLSTPVTAIESTVDSADDPKVLIKTSDGSHFTVDEVVVTVPLGCLKRNKPGFSPPLPSRMTRAIRDASYCTLDKIYITFPSAFWERFPTEQEQEQSQDNSAPELPPFVHFLRPTSYVPPPSTSYCTLEMAPLSSRATFGAEFSQPTLLFYTYDPCSTHLSQLVRGLAPGGPAYTAALADFFRPFYSRLPHYDAAAPECEPSGILFSDWHGDDLAGNGCYTNFQVSPRVTSSSSGGGKADEVLLDEDVRAVREGLPERGIWFAGEHVAPFVGLGTTTGAYWSGEMAAMRVLAANGIVAGTAEHASNE